MNGLPTPISILEGHFGEQLTLNDMSYWDGIADKAWIDFARAYLEQMEAGFTPQAMADRVDGQKIRLYFDKNFGEDYDKATEGRYARTPLIGLSQYPADDVDYRHEGLNQVIAPLAKHLLVSDEVYLTDSFYRCFDSFADTYGRFDWQREDPWGLEMRVAAIRRWLLILAGLRDLITSGVINFFPYYVIPSFTKMVDAAKGRRANDVDPFMARLHIPHDPSLKAPGEVEIDFKNFGKQPPKVAPTKDEPTLDTDAAVAGWIDARLLGFDPVYANEKTWRWASGIRFRDETKMQATSDLMSIDIIPLRGDKGLSLKDVMSMRKGEKVFKHVRDTLIGCKDHLRDNVSENATSEFVRKTCREFIRDTLDPREKYKTIKFLDNDLVAASALSVGVGALFLTANPLIALAAGALLTPKVFLKAAGALDPEIRAAVRLEALL